MFALDTSSHVVAERRGNGLPPQFRNESGYHRRRFVLLSAGSGALEPCSVSRTSAAISECSSPHEDFVGLVSVKTLLALHLSSGQSSCVLGGGHRVTAPVLNACQLWVQREGGRHVR